MASGPDALAEFLPDLAAAKGFLPNEALNAQLIQNITDAQQSRIKQMGDLRAQSAGAPYAGAQNLLSSAEQGYKFGSEEQTNAAKRAQTESLTAQNQAATGAQTIANQAAKDKLQLAEEQNAWMHQPDPLAGSDANHPAGGTRADAARQSDYKTMLQTPEFAAQKMANDTNEAKSRVTQSNALAASYGIQNKSALDQQDQDRFLNVIDGISRTTPAGPDRDKAIQAATAEAQTGGRLPPSQYAALAQIHPQIVDAQQKSNAAAAETNATLGVPYQQLTDATQKATGGANAVKSLQAQLAALKSGSVGFLHSPNAQAAVDGAAATLDQLGKAGDGQAATWAQQLRSSNPIDGTAQNQLQQIIPQLSQRVQQTWQTNQTQITPAMQNRNEFKTTNQLVQSLGQAPGMQSPGQIFQPQKSANTAFTNPPKPPAGQAQAAPAPGPTPPGPGPLQFPANQLQPMDQP